MLALTLIDRAQLDLLALLGGGMRRGPNCNMP